MNFKRIFFLILLFSIIISIGIVSASDVNNTTSDSLTQSNEMDLTNINEGETSSDNSISSQEDNSRVIYVGQNKTTDGGNGTEDNPFESFELASKNLSGENKVEINVYNGTYYINSDLKFNTNNLFITGMGNVLIKNLENKDGCHASFGLTYTNGNFTFSNLIFDGSNCSSLSSVSINKPYFHVFKGTANLGTLYNCTFTGFKDDMMFSSQFDRKFISCNFLDSYNYISFERWYTGLMIDFEYCIISSEIYLGIMPLTRNSYLNLTYNNVWLGSNRVDNYLYYDAVSSSGSVIQKPANFGRYAVFSAYENYLENDTYEIIGNLTWNDGTTKGIELLNPLIVTIATRTGQTPKETILRNGTFKETYKSNSQDNEIEIELDSQEAILEFKNGLHVVANPIYVGDNQIITVTLPQAVNAPVNITVNNKTYEVQPNGSSTFNFTVPKELPAGKYQVDVKIIDKKNHVYGVNSTNWTISKINKNIIIIAPAKSYITDASINITVLLEKDASGNITVFANDKNIIRECYGRNIEIDISSILNPGENDVTVVYSGNKKYLNQTKEDKIFVNKIYPNINITKPSNPIIGDEININITLPLNATGSLMVSAGDKNVSINNVSNKNTINISNLLNAGYNTLSIYYSGDDFWDSQIKKETIYVDKITPVMNVEISQNIVKVGENVTLQIYLPKEASGNLSVNGNCINRTNELTIVDIPCLLAGINQINVTYDGNDLYHEQSKIINISVEKWNIPLNEMKITVNNHTTPSFIITLPGDVTGNITIKVNDKKYTEALVNGKSSLKIYDLMPGIYGAEIIYSGDGKFNSLSTNVKFSVPKPILKANDVNMLYASGLKYTVYVTVSGSPVVGKTVVLTINGKKTTAVTDNKGCASVKIDLPPKSTKYSVTAEYQGVKITNKVKVNSIIQAKNLKVKNLAKTLKIKVSLKKVNGKYLKNKKITLKFKGKKYTAKTNKKGVVIFKINKKVIKKLKAGKKYKYQVNYLKDTVSKKVMVKK